jgi:hypothetical protein
MELIESSLFGLHPDQTETFFCGPILAARLTSPRKSRDIPKALFVWNLEQMALLKITSGFPIQNELVPTLYQIGYRTTDCIEKGFDHTIIILLYKILQ